MSYRENLGKVIGKEGKVYIPKTIERDGKKYITWELKDKEGAQPDDIDITPKAYRPSISSGGEISFILTTDLPDALSSNINIKGPKGDAGEVNTTVVDSLPSKASAKEGIIYIHDGGIATVFDEDRDEFYDLDNLVKFDDYYTKDEVQDEFYTKSQVDAMLGSIIQAQEAIIYTLDKDSVNISSGD